MIRPILVYPNKRLRAKSKAIEAFDDGLNQLLDDMHDTMIEYKGVGIAAIQIGIALRALVINIPNEDGIQTIDGRIEAINPNIVLAEGSAVCSEGCLSIPEFNEEVERYERVRVEFYDRHGVFNTIDAEGLLAIAFQHEMDHLDG
ncbi:MAG: peptide deformylase, partial [Helicobacteraceae bacterium]|nr:peptide deformylase [Helicobacteraceae bacterium]